MNIEEHVIAALLDAPKFGVPFPHFFAKNVFPADFYAKLLGILAQKDDFHEERFKNRGFAAEIGVPELDFMQEKPFFRAMMKLFRPETEKLVKSGVTQFGRDLRLIRDSKSYKIGPHTDSPAKVISLLFYLPATDEYRDYGTSIFLSDDPAFECEGGPHYGFESFREAWRAPYLPNSCFGFWKTTKSFHGVMPLPVQFRRDVLLYNVYQPRDTD